MDLEKIPDYNFTKLSKESDIQRKMMAQVPRECHKKCSEVKITHFDDLNKIENYKIEKEDFYESAEAINFWVEDFFYN